MEINLITWNHEPSLWCRGHVAPEVFAAAVKRLEGEDVAPSSVAHYWGRWVPSRGEFDQLLITVPGPARGAFAFTVWETMMT